MKNLFFFNQRSNATAQAARCAYIFSLVFAMLMTLGVGEMWGEDYYLRGVNGNWDASSANKMTAGSNNIVWMSHATNSGYVGFLITAGTSYDTKYGQNSGNAVFGSPYLMKQGGNNAYTDNWSSGTYYYYFNTSTLYLTVYKTIEIKGGLMSTGWDNSTSMTFQSGDGSWKQNCTATLTAGSSYYFKIHANGTWTGYSNKVSCTNGTATAENGNNGDNIKVIPTHGGNAVVVFHPEAGGTINVYCPYQVSYAAGTGASGSVSASAVTTYGSTCTLSSSTFTKAGYTQDGWATSDGGDKAYNLGATYTGGYTDVTLYPHWVENKSTVSLVASPTGKGSFTIGGAAATSTTAGVTTTRSVTAVPISGYHFVSWAVTGGASVTSTTTNPTTLSGDGSGEDATLTATFAADNVYTLTVAAGTGISAVTGTTNNIKAAQNIAITATVADGYTWSTWTKTGAGTLSTYTPGTKDQTVTVGTAGDITLTASATENMSTLTTSNHYDAGNPSYAAPTISNSATDVGYVTTRTITAAAAGTGYTFTGWTLTNCTRTDGGGAATANPITIRSNGDGAAASVVANYEEVRTSTYYVVGNTGPFEDLGWSAVPGNMMKKKSGYSTATDVYFDIDVAAGDLTMDDTNWAFKIYNSAGADDAAKWIGWKSSEPSESSNKYWLTKDNNSVTLVTTGSNDLQFRPDVAGRYVFHLDYSTAASPVLTINWPAAVYLSTNDENAYADGSVTLTAQGANLASGSKTIEYEFFKGTTLTDAYRVGTKQTFNSITATSHSTTQAASPAFSTSDYSASQVYTVRMTVDGTPYTNTVTIYRKWDIKVRDAFSWGQIKLYSWGANGQNADYPGSLCSNISGNWYTVTLSSKFEGFVLSQDGDDTKTADLDVDDYAEGTCWYITANSGGSLTAVVAPSVEIKPNDAGTYVVNTNQLRLTAEITNFGNDGTRARDMVEVGFMIGETKYPIPNTCTSEENGWFWGGITGLTAGTEYTVKAYATNFAGTTVSTNSATMTTRAAGTTTIKVRVALEEATPKVYAWTSKDCGGAFSDNASYPGVSMGDPIITGTVYKWFSYNISNEFNQFVVCQGADAAAADLVKTDDFDNPLTETCYWYAPTENNEEGHKRMGSMTCPYVTPQLMIETTAGGGEYEYLEMSGSGTVTKTVTLTAKSQYLFKIVYNAEWYGKASVNVTRAANTVTETSAAIEDNMAITTDAAGSYTFSFNTSTKAITVTYPTAYTVTFGMGTGGATIGASATSAGGSMTSGDYVAAGDDVTFTQTASSEGYTFAGWYDASTGGSAVSGMGTSDNVLDDIADNATVYSRYTPNNYTVSFDATTNGGTCGTPSKSVTYAAAYGELPTATRASKAFKGWFTTSDGSTQVTAETLVSTASNHTIYAQFEDIYSVTIDYKCGDVKLRNSSSTHASATALAPTIEAPEFLGYTFTGWSGSNATFADDRSATTTVNAEALTTITANYSVIPTVYFKNNLNWDKVYVTFDCDWTTGSNNVPKNNGKPYFEMEQLGTSDIFSCVIPDAYVTSNFASWANNIAFDNHGFEASENIGSHTGGFNAGEFLGRGDFDPSATMFIPYNGDSEERNGGTYYRTGCWMKYNSTDPGYKVYANTHVSGSDGSAVDGTPVLLKADIAGGFEFKAKVNFPSANYTYGFMLHKEYTKNSDAVWYTNTGTITAETDDLPWHFYNDGASEDGTRCGLKTESTGEYEFTVSFGTGRPVVNVTYPVSTGDWRLVYKDRAAWSGDAHDADWFIASRVIKAEADAVDTVSFFVSKATGANATVELQKCTEIDPETAAETWEKQGSNLDLSSITSTGIYNFRIVQNGSKEASAAYLGGYVGNFYIRTDAAEGGWSNYKTSGSNTMTYSEYAEEHYDYFTHYFMKFVNTGTNIKFCIANDYSPCLTEYCVSDDYTNEWIEVYGNVRFMWDHRTNKVSRAYISGSGFVADRFLVLEGDDKMFDKDGNELTEAGSGKVSELNDYEMNFTDDQNWIYETSVQAKPGARIKLTARYNGKIQYFYGAEGDRDEETTDMLIGGSGTDKYKVRIVYDFKTNRLMKAFMPEGAINDDLEINADLMIMREAQGDAQQITFGENGALSLVKTVYGSMKFNKYTVNNKEKTGGHNDLDLTSYERDIFYISFPFEVKLSDVFGFGTYGKHWIIEYYDGKGRAKNGYWADSEPNWKFVMPSQRSSFTLKANEGYILALDLEEMTFGSNIWNNGVEDVYLYFPSNGYVNDIEATDKLVEIDQTGYECKIGPRFSGGDDRRVKDSYWHCIGVPSFASYNKDMSETESGTTIDWRSTSMPYLYEWNSTSNTMSITTSETFIFKPMYSYLVQYAGESIYWSQVNATPSGVVARQKDVPTNVEFRLELQQDEQKADQAFVRLSDDEHVTTGFDFNYDLSKEFNNGKANVYTMITSMIDNEVSVTEAAGNVLPMTEQTTIVPIGVKVATNDDYTFSIPEGTEGIGVTLIDTETGIRTNLSAVDYTISLEAGKYDERFVLEISPIKHVPTEVETSDIRDQKSDVRKMLIDGLLYIVRDNKVYDARGARVE